MSERQPVLPLCLNPELVAAAERFNREMAEAAVRLNEACKPVLDAYVAAAVAMSDRLAESRRSQRR